MASRHHHGRGSTTSLALGLLVLAGGVASAAFLARGRRNDHGIEDAPARAVKEQTGTSRIVGRSVTIAKPRMDVYRAWRDFGRFPDFMENVISVEMLDQTRSHWSVEGPGGSMIEFVSEITEDRPGEAISWSSEDGAAVPNSGHITFQDAPGGRGTEVDLDIAYEPPGGAVGALIVKMFQREPRIQARRDLKRFKQLMETGEIATSRHRRATAADHS